MYAIRNKKTGKLLTVQPKVNGFNHWMPFRDESISTIVKFLELSEDWHVIFVTADEELLEDLLKEGKSTYPHVEIDFGWNSSVGKPKYSVEDFEKVELCLVSIPKE